MVLKISKSNVFLSVFLFCGIFAPPVIKNVNFMYIVAAFSIIALLTNYNEAFHKLLRTKWLTYFNIGIAIWAFYYIIVVIVSSVSGTQMEIVNCAKVFYRFFSIIFIMEPMALYVVCYTRKRNIDINQVIECIIYAGVIQSIISIFTFVSPEIKSFLNNIMFINAYGDSYMNIPSWQLNGRYYGFAQILVDFFGFATGMMSVICLLYAYFVKKKFYIYLPFLVFMTAINAITGIVIFALGFVFILFDKKLNKKKIFWIILLPILFVGAFYLMSSIAPVAMNRLMNNFYQIFAEERVTANATSVANLFSERFWELPDTNTKIVFGTGNPVFRSKYYANSDVGYINDIWSFGIIGLVMSIIIYNGLLKNKCITNGFSKKILTFLFISIWVFNIKGVAIGCNPGNCIIIILACCLHFCDVHNEVEGVKNE